MALRRAAIVLALGVVVSGLYVSPATRSVARADPHPGMVMAGVGKADSTFHVGASAGQYASLQVDGEGPAHNLDPYGHQTKNAPSYGIHSRLSARAVVIEGADETRVAFVKNDLYIPQDLLNTRVATILREHDLLVKAGLREGPVTGITHANLVIGVTHSHSSPYYSSPSWGLWAFQDVFDIRYFENIAQAHADAVIEAAGNLVPVRMGAASTYFDHTQKHSYGPAIADDGTPAGYPRTDNDHAVGLLRFDDISDPDNPKPLANLVTFGQHPEMLEGNNLITAEYVGTLERVADWETGAMTVFLQNNTGTSEAEESASHPISARAEYSHREYAQAERGGRRIADAIIEAWTAIETGSRAPGLEALLPDYDRRIVPFSTDFPVMVNDKQFAPPYSHPYPSVSNCRTHEAVAQGNPGVPIAGLPDCERIMGRNAGSAFEGFENEFENESGEEIPEELKPSVTINRLQDGLAGVGSEVYAQAKAHGVPLPENYGALSYAGLQETFQVHLQAIRLGEVLLTICPCEQWSDQSFNIKTRADKVEGNMQIGFDWSSYCEQNTDGTWNCPNPSDPSVDLPPISDASYQRMKAQVNNDARGWDEGWEECHDIVTSESASENSFNNNGECPLRAESEPVDPDKIKGNYTQTPFVPAEWLEEPFPAELSSTTGYDLVLPIGMANDYWGYIATYREYSRGDHYRKALTGLGAHSSDFFATRLVTMGGHLKGGADYPLTALDRAYEVDGLHQEARAEVIGKIADFYLPLYGATLPTDGGSPGAVDGGQPKDIARFDAAQFTWIGGSNYSDDPHVTVQRLENGEWVEAGNMSGEVVATIDFPEPEQLPEWRAGRYQWKWSATYEAFDSDIDTGRGNQTPTGTYRFVVNGRHRGSPTSEDGTPYSVTSESFEIARWEGITIPDIRLEEDGRVSFAVGPVNNKEFFRSDYPAGGNTKKTTIAVGPIDYPDTWQTAPLPTEPEGGDKLFPRLERTLIGGDFDGNNYLGGGELFCFSCTFRPWIDTGQVASATVTVVRADGTTGSVPAYQENGRWFADAGLYEGDRAFVAREGIVDTFGEINGEPSAEVVGTRPKPDPDPTPTPTVEPSPTTGPDPSVDTTMSTPAGAVDYGEPVVLSGQVTIDGDCDGLVSVSVVKHPYGARWNEATLAHVARDGTWAVDFTGDRNASYKASVTAEGCSGGSAGPIDVLVRARITLDRVPRCRGTTNLTGRVFANNAGYGMTLQKRSTGRWVTIDGDRLGPKSRFVLETKKRCAGSYRIVGPLLSPRNQPSIKTFRLR